MTEKVSNLITRTIVGVLFVIVMVGGIVWRPDTMLLLFAVITGMTLWEYTGLVNDYVRDVRVNRFISTVAGIYLFLAVAATQLGLTEGFVAFVPYILTLVYLFISELYLKGNNPINDWAYTALGQFYVAFPISLINILAFKTNADTMLIADSSMPVYDPLLPLSIFIFLWTLGFHLPLDQRHGCLLQRLPAWQAQAVPAYQSGQDMGRQHWRRHPRAHRSGRNRLLVQ